MLERSGWVLPFVVVAEMRFGARVANWGTRRTAVLERLVANTQVSPPLPEVIDAYVELRTWCANNGHGLGAKDHEADRWSPQQRSLAGSRSPPTTAFSTPSTASNSCVPARNLFLRHSDQLTDARALLRDRGGQFIDAFDEIFRTEHMKILRTPIQTPVANAFAERWIGTLRRELLDRTLIWNRRQLDRLVADYIDHYNTHRPHRSLDQRPPAGADDEQPPDRPLQVARSTRCDGLTHEYRNAA